MQKVVRPIAAAAVLGLVVVGIGAFWPSAADAASPWGNHFILTSHQTNIETNGVPGEPTAPPAPGQTIAVREDLLKDGKVVGFDNVVCTVTFNDNALCTAWNHIYGQGAFSEVALIHIDQNGLAPFDTHVTGGTGAFTNMHGWAHVTPVGPTDTRGEYHLTS